MYNVINVDIIRINISTLFYICIITIVLIIQHCPVLFIHTCSEYSSCGITNSIFLSFMRHLDCVHSTEGAK